MTAKTITPPGYRSGWHSSGLDERCVGVYAGTVCTHPLHTTPDVLGGDVHAGRLETPAKDTPKAAPLAAAGAPAAPPSAALTDLTATVAAASEAVAGWLDDAAEIEALDTLAVVRRARLDLAQVEAVVEARAARLMSGNVVEWPGGVAERRFGKDRKAWAHDELIRAVANLVAAEAATDRESGEVDEMLAAVVQDAVAVFAATHRPEWRITALKQLGIDADEFCEAIPGRNTVQITQAGAA